MTHRFINADTKYVSTGTGIVGINMFAYCDNNPINCIDPSGNACVCLTNRVRPGHVCNDPSKAYVLSSSGGVFGAGIKVSSYIATQSVNLCIAGTESGVVSGKEVLGNTSRPVSFFVESDVEWWNFDELNLGIQFNFKNERGVALSKNYNDIVLSTTKDGVSHSFSYGTDMIAYTVESGTENIDGVYVGSYSQFYYRPNVAALYIVAVLIPGSATVVVPALV